MKNFPGKVIAITEAASGIGQEIVRQLAEKGAKFSLADINSEQLLDFAKELKAKDIEVVTTSFDVSKYDAMMDFAEKTFKTFGTHPHIAPMVEARYHR